MSLALVDALEGLVCRPNVDRPQQTMPIREQTSVDEVVFGDPFTEQMLVLASRVARTEVTVLIGGPSGTGKEVLARFIHQNSLRSGGRFIAFNCACNKINNCSDTFSNRRSNGRIKEEMIIEFDPDNSVDPIIEEKKPKKDSKINRMLEKMKQDSEAEKKEKIEFEF